MGKNYTLYLKDNNDKFDREINKSDLVNLLLSRHYDYFKPGTLVEDLPPEKLNIIGNPDLQKQVDKEGWTGPIPKSKNLCKKHNVDKSICAMMKH